jgi:hypothetical protein
MPESSMLAQAFVFTRCVSNSELDLVASFLGQLSPLD